jgi:FtsP/CotA-like multicopper oxidase with cupredoxin domain
MRCKTCGILPGPPHLFASLVCVLSSVLIGFAAPRNPVLPTNQKTASSLAPSAQTRNIRNKTFYAPQTRQYFIAAEPVDWDYAQLGKDKLRLALPKPWQGSQKYSKYRYVEYTDNTFTTPVHQPPWLGILGPIIRGVVGDTLRITFLNRSDREDRVFSIHPHGLRYDKNNEGTYSYPDTRQGSWITRSNRYTYTWNVDKEAGPETGEPSSKVWLYHSHVIADEDINRGLIGVIVITDQAHARPDRTPTDVDREFVTLFMIFNQNEGLKDKDMDMTDKKDKDNDETKPELKQKREAFSRLTPAEQLEALEAGLKHTINGYIFGNLPDLEMYEGERVRWYVVALGSKRDLHTAHWHGETVVEDGRRRTDDIELLPGSMKVADMKANNPGTWMFHCHVSDHMMGGMYAFYVVHSR